MLAVAWEELLPAFGELLDCADGPLDEPEGLLDGFAVAAVSDRIMRRTSSRMPR